MSNFSGLAAVPAAHDARPRPRTPSPADTGPISVMPQVFEPFLANALDTVPPECLPTLHLRGTVEGVRLGLVDGLAACGLEPSWLGDWLVENVLFQVRLFGELTRAARFAVRLETVDDDNCRRFHTDNVRYRLVTTYRGPGTEWIAPKSLAGSPATARIPESAINRLDRGWVAFYRGSKAATAERPALVHRSPPIEGTGVTRLVLVVDEDD